MKESFINWVKQNKKHPRARRLLSFIRRNNVEGLEDKTGFYSIYDILDMEYATRDIMNDFEYLYEEYKIQ